MEKGTRHSGETLEKMRVAARARWDKAGVREKAVKRGKAKWEEMDGVERSKVMGQRGRGLVMSRERAEEIRLQGVERSLREGRECLERMAERWPELLMLADVMDSRWSPREIVTLWWLAMDPGERPMTEAELTREMGVSPLYVQREVNRRGVYRAVQQAMYFNLVRRRGELDRSVMKSALPHVGLDKDGVVVELGGDPRSQEIWRKMDEAARKELGLVEVKEGAREVGQGIGDVVVEYLKSRERQVREVEAMRVEEG